MNRVIIVILVTWAALSVACSAILAESAEPKAKPADSSQPADILAWAEQLLKNAEQLESYSSIVVCRERVDGELSEYRHVFLKFRRQPKSFYMYFMGPLPLQGQECLYVAGRHEGNMRCHPGRGIHGCIGSVHLHPRSFLATKGVLCPLDILNVSDLTQQAIDYIKENTVQGKSEVRQFKEAKINGRVSTVFELKHHNPKPATDDNPPSSFSMRLFAAALSEISQLAGRI